LYHGAIKSLPEQLQTDFLIVGAGVAGLRAAIELARCGRVLVVAKDSLRESSSEYAQGGIAVALSDDDEVELHEQDTLNAGDGLCNEDAVRVLVEEGPAGIQELIDWGVEFDREGSKLLFAREGAHSRNRVLHSHGDSTGREIARTLYHKAASLENVTFLSFAAIVDLLKNGERVTGALALGPESRGWVEIQARSVLLATGGLGRVYLETTNPDVATGDGVAMAWRAGAQISDIEFVQFHPTALHKEGAPRFLLSEALRGEGAWLVNAVGERFMERYHAMGELAPRDVVSRSIVEEMRRTGAPHVFLDLRHRGAGFVAKRFPRIYETCLAQGVDLEKEAAPVHPAAHYAMGGVWTDLNGRTTVEGLYAAGEAACTGVHGANRLASNSLLEGLVYGARAGRTMGQAGAAAAGRERPELRVPQIGETEVRTLAWERCGIVRSGAGLSGAIGRLGGLEWKREEHPSRAECELRSLATVARLIAECAAAREESRGAHRRIDYPEKDPSFERHSCIAQDSGPVGFD
jgi:L-aspartate oxidase